MGVSGGLLARLKSFVRIRKTDFLSGLGSSRGMAEFNVKALENAASQVTGAPCSRITKLPEGLYNKVFSLEAECGEEILARIPNPNAGSPRHLVSSEVATLDFLRNVVNVPVPEVVGWSSCASQSNSVGAEYILMKRIKGHQLSDIWHTMSESQRFGLVKNVVAIEAKLASVNILGYGSLYYRDDFPDGLTVSMPTCGSDEDILRKFALGPDTDRPFWIDDREALDLDLGPWKTATEYFTAITKREIACVRKSTSEESGIRPLISGGNGEAKERHIQLLEQFLTVLPYLLPPEEFCRPVLLHHDLHADNIFVDEADPTKITGVIDWQGAFAGPLFMQAGFPSVFDCDDPYSWGANQPELPEDFDILSEQERTAVREQHERIRLKKFYELASRKFNPDITRAMDAMRNDEDPASFIFHLVGQTSKDGPIPLRELLMQVYEKWDWISARRGFKGPCPISFSGEDIARYREIAERWAEAYSEFNDLLTEMGDKEGWVPHEEFDVAMHHFNEHKELLQVLRERVEKALCCT